MSVKGADNRRILWFATQGADSLDAERMRELLAHRRAEMYAFDRTHKVRSALGLVSAVRKSRPRLIVMEGTGLAGGLALLAIDGLLGVPFVVSSGDAVGPYLRLRSRALGALGGLYERLLCGRSAGYVGWTPYLVGRALTFGAPRGMTAPGWARGEAAEGAREAVRRRLGIPADAVVIGLVGSLRWNPSVGYAYGAELVQAVRKLARRDVVACIIGEGSGRERLQAMAGDDLGGRILLPGRVAPQDVPDHLAAFDLASLPQSVDAVGSFRYTTKMSEYLAAALPIVLGEIPAAYDLDEGSFWRVPGRAPWSQTYVDGLAELLEGLTPSAIAERRSALQDRQAGTFEKAAQQRRFGAFLDDLTAAP